MEMGLSTLLLRKQPLDYELLAAIKKAGVDAVELTDYHPGFIYGNRDYLLDVRKHIESLELHLNSLHIHLEKFDPAYNLSAVDAAERKQTLSAYRRAIDDMAILGGRILVTHNIRIPEPNEADHATTHETFVNTVGSIAHYALERGISLALENTGHGYTREPERLVNLIAAIGASNVGVCIDTGHRNLCGDPVSALRIVGGNLFTLHIHDNHGEKDEHLLPGDGIIDWSGIYQALFDISYAGVFMYELSRAEHLDAVQSNFSGLIAEQ